MQVRDACWAIGLRGGEVGAGEEVVGGFAGVMEFEPGMAAGGGVTDSSCAHWMLVRFWRYRGEDGGFGVSSFG